MSLLWCILPFLRDSSGSLWWNSISPCEYHDHLSEAWKSGSVKCNGGIILPPFLQPLSQAILLIIWPSAELLKKMNVCWPANLHYLLLKQKVLHRSWTIKWPTELSARVLMLTAEDKKSVKTTPGHLRSFLYMNLISVGISLTHCYAFSPWCAWGNRQGCPSCGSWVTSGSSMTVVTLCQVTVMAEGQFAPWAGVYEPSQILG